MSTCYYFVRNSEERIVFESLPFIDMLTGIQDIYFDGSMDAHYELDDSFPIHDNAIPGCGNYLWIFKLMPQSLILDITRYGANKPDFMLETISERIGPDIEIWSEHQCFDHFGDHFYDMPYTPVTLTTEAK